ncbi:MAG: hypothetical protein AAGB05_14635 [Pseudomonadota bacterium]
MFFPSTVLRPTLVLALYAGLFAGAYPFQSAASDACPSVSRDANAEQALISALQEAPDAGVARSINADLWSLWTRAPDSHAQELLDSAMARIRMGDLGNAMNALDALVAYCPSYAEGYNQRAFARYLARDFAAALEDIDVALSYSPRHIGALSGKALTLIGLGRDRAALTALNQALSLNPWLSERALLGELERRLGARDL